jgi:8-oxo-dGTP pyrophosphatase MutT (NUDIX family)/phosphohistidine phosphatase SixA
VSSPPDRVVAAAGGAVWRHGPDGGTEVALVHRPRYDDWSLPKGKLEAGEHALTAAVREIGEETGLEVVAGRRGVRTRYPVTEGVKRVDYWVMRALGGNFEPNDEVDELRWLPLREAAELCSHDADRVVLADVARVDVPLMPALVLVRHGRAGDRANWRGPDDLRPLDDRGWRQAQRLAQVLPLFGPTALLSVPRTRCEQTMAPLGQRLGLPVTAIPEFGEEEFADDPEAGLSALERFLGGSGVTVVCSQGGAIPAALESLGVKADGRDHPPSAKGSVWVLGGRAGALSADYYRNLEPDPDAPAAR